MQSYTLNHTPAEADIDWFSAQEIGRSIPADDSFDWYQPSTTFQQDTFKPGIALIGLGPHSKRIYMHFLAKAGKTPKLVIELESKRRETLLYLIKHNITAYTYFIPDEYKDREVLPNYLAYDLTKLFKRHGIEKAIISTEPKAHKAYLNLFLKADIDILTDKPITAPSFVADEPKQSAMIWRDFVDLRQSAANNSALTEVQCQRRYHVGYRYIREVLAKVVKDYQVPITYIDSYHCDGMWNMPNEFMQRENHPYKYGYGKLFHSGYHFLDLVAWLTQINEQLPDKAADNFQLYASATRAEDTLHTQTPEDCVRLVGEQTIPEHFTATGEVDFHSLITFKRGGRTVTTANLSLLQNGFSRRSWADLPADTYKGNGRVRHERINIHVGPLLNIQVHSYQAKEVKARTTGGETQPGDLEHFDIFIFRNSDIIGGKTFEKLTTADLCGDNSDGGFIGVNEAAREDCLNRFIQGNAGDSALEDHALTVKLLEKSYESLSRQAQGEIGVVQAAAEEWRKAT